jgi:hypothetical protein
MRASVSFSSGPMCTNCEDVQHAVHSPQGTSTSSPARSTSHVENRPAVMSGGASVVAQYLGDSAP